MADLGNDNRSGGRRGVLIAAIAVTVVLSWLPFGGLVLYPFTLFATWVHEMCHGLAAIVVGGDFETLVVRPDTSGQATYTGDFGRLGRAFVASAGYVGTTIFGATIVASQASRRASRTLLSILGGTMLLSVLLWVRNPFGMVACVAMGLGLLLLSKPFGKRFDERWQPLLLAYLGAQTCVNALLSIRALYGAGEHSDARTMAALFWFPHWFWATLWLALSLGVLIAVLRLDARSGREARE